ncbi:8760_t:CDS:1 [Funneliformis geosporum]|uniref:14473_t:CDS:1 n=1 Tax=Funneliformis geosporum TaxID=1117311 RepID=A0A9W4WN76_9GLOM|nr:14473_t:CDS:1 [Funneliformis geosporum]CAI2166611.1 8760_t:CDS:1 [Funneliformis geosporum]
MSNLESMRPSIEETPLTPMTENTMDTLAPTTTRDSIITYSTDLGDSSLTTDDVYVTKREKEVSSGITNPSPFYRRRRFWALCAAISTIISAIFLPLLFLVIVPTVAQNTVNKSHIEFQVINITNASDDQFDTEMTGVASNAGLFDATMKFTDSMIVLYKGNKIGSVKLEDIKVTKGKGKISGKNTFTISNKTAFELFTKDSMLEESFVWTLQGNANVQAFGITTKNLHVNKNVTIPGGNGFKSKLTNLKVSQNPDKTLQMEMTTILHNTSPICMELGNLTFQVQSGETVMANVTSNYVYLTTNENTLTLTGTANLPTNAIDQLNFLKVIEAYLSNKPFNTTAKGVKNELKGGPVDWLNTAISSLTITAELGGAEKAPQLISEVDLGQLSMKFTPETAFSPLISAKNTTAKFIPPFDVEFQILSLQQKLTINYQGKSVAVIQTPETNVTTVNDEILLDVPETTLQAFDGFSDLLVVLTTTAGSDVEIIGEANITSNSPMGVGTIHGVPFNVTSRMEGLNQFNSPGKEPVVSNINILAGTTNQIIIGSIVTLANPTSFSVSIGQVGFDLYYNDSKIGTVAIDDLSIVPGPNPVQVIITLDDPANNAGNDLLVSYLSGKETILNIKGNDDSTKVSSMIPAFKAINIPSPLPPFNLPLITKANMEVTPQSALDNSTIAIVEMTNPFDAPISIYTMDSSFEINGTSLGSVQQDLKDNPIFLQGHVTQKLGFNVKMSLDIESTITILRNLALAKGMDVSGLDTLITAFHLNIPGANSNVIPINGQSKPFNPSTFITTALKEIPTHITLDAQVAIGNYFLPSLKYQQDINVETDDSIVYLLASILKF